MASVKWTIPAVSQLEAILEFIALDKPDVAKRLAKEIVDKVARLAGFPQLGRPVPELNHPAYRQIWIKPCWIYYRIDDSNIYVIHVRRAETDFHLEDLI